MSIGDLATTLTVAGVSISVLGLIGLAIPIRRVYTGDITTAWYAVSLVPKTVVAGQGVRIWLQWPVSIAAALFVMLAVVRSPVFLLPFRIVSAKPNLSAALLYVTIVACAILLFFFGKRYRHLLLSLLKQAPRPSAFKFLLTAVGLLVPALAGLALLIISIAMLTSPEFYDWLDWILPVFYRFPGILVLLTGSFLFGLPFAIWASPPLPEVQIIKHPEDTTEGVPDKLEGSLVAHSDEFWHLFVDADEAHQEQRDDTGEKRYDLISIFDEKTLLVRTFGKRPAEAAPKTEGQRGAEARPEPGQGREAGSSPPERPAPE